MSPWTTQPQHETRSTTISTRIFVGNLSFRTTKEELLALLAEVGTVTDVHLPADRETGKPRGFAFVEFSTAAEAAEAIRRFNGRELGGRALKVNPAEARPQGGDRARPMPPFALEAGPSFFAVDGRPSRNKGSRRNLRGRKRGL